MNEEEFNKKNENFYEIVLMIVGLVALAVLIEYRFVEELGLISYVLGVALGIIGVLKVIRLSKNSLWRGASWEKLKKTKQERVGLNVILIVALVSYSING